MKSMLGKRIHQIFQMFQQMDLLKRNLRCVYENKEATVMYMYFIPVLYIIFVV